MPPFPTLIDSFTGAWGFLSNFYPCNVTLDGIPYRSVEHAYQAAKTLKLKEREKFTFDITPGQAKRMGSALFERGLQREDWLTGAREQVMHDLVLQKFYPTILRRKLLCTFTAQLIEGNHHHDTFWGVCMGGCRNGRHEPIGDNKLGQLLMGVRRHYGKL